jgi:hypothetical protein
VLLFLFSGSGASAGVIATPTTVGALTWGEIVDDAYIEIRVKRSGEELTPEQMEDGLRVLRRILDSWNSNRRAVYSASFADYTLTPGLSPHTIGPGGTFNVTQRPVAIDAVSVNFGTIANPILVPVTVRDDAWYALQPMPASSFSVPSDVYYSAEWPLGKLYFWGVPTIAYRVRVWTRQVLSSVVQTDTFSLPPGYQHALTLTLAESIAKRNGQKVSDDTKREARDARTLIFGNNDPNLRIATRDSGIPSAGNSSGVGFDARSRRWIN